MGWIVETIIDLLMDEWIYATYKRYGWLWAIAVAIGPIVAIAAIVAIAFLLLRTN